MDYSSDSPTRGRLLSVNPLGQVPSLVLPGGRVMTESLAILHYIDDRAPQAKLVPAKGDPSREALWKQLDAVAGSPWFLGERFSALDLYCAVMVHWRPGRKWLEANAPKIMAIAKRAAALEAVAPVIAKSFS